MTSENATTNLRQLLEEVIERGASDLHLTVGQAPRLRVDGHLTDSRIGSRLTPRDTQALAYSVLTEQQKKRFEQESE
ncbi:MAG: type IV pili twitching motility protein PilT, partial [Gemmatimonadota bacterium]